MAPPRRRPSSRTLASALGLSALMGAAVLQGSAGHAASVSGTASLAPGNQYSAKAGDSFNLDFSGIFGDPLMEAGNYWQFNIGETKGSASFANLGWEVSLDNGTNWGKVAWNNFDPMGPTSAVTVPGLNGGNNFPPNTETIGLTFAGAGQTLTSAFLAKSDYPTVTNVRLVGDVSANSTPYLTKFSISDLTWNGADAPIYNNAYQASLRYDVPGPLPVLGAVSALAMARRLRRRVQLTAPC